MVYVLILAHLLGDYVFQFDFIARWKTRSLWGVVAHGGIVTLTSVVCVLAVHAAWWPYALVVGATHTLLDVVRARFVRTTQPRIELAWFVLDQLLHLVIIGLVAEGAVPAGSLREPSPLGAMDRRVLHYAIGYLLLLNPAWVVLRFFVRGIWGPEAAPRLGQGEKYGPMVERVLIAACVLSGHFYLAPLVLVPRRVTPVRVEGQGVGVLVRTTYHWGDTFLSATLALLVGLFLRVMNVSG
jgi:hypothetical protein